MMEDKVLQLEYVAKVGDLLPYHFGPSVGEGGRCFIWSWSSSVVSGGT